MVVVLRDASYTVLESLLVSGMATRVGCLEDISDDSPLYCRYNAGGDADYHTGRSEFRRVKKYNDTAGEKVSHLG